MSQIVSAKITKIEKHPNASKLKVCHVSDGTKTHQIVCGASNVSENMVTILAKPGSTLPTGKVIESATLRGVESNGMLCSPKDLDVANENGLIILNKATSLGKDFCEFKSSELSSTPWFEFKWVDSLIECQGKIRSVNKRSELLASEKIISETYWDGKEYLYRHY